MKQLNNETMKIAIALSGGVDSAVAAKILKDEGYQLVGFFLKLWSDPTSPSGLRGTSPTSPTSLSSFAGQAQNCSIKENRCCDYEALEDARSVASKLGIPFYVIDAKEEFKKEVVDYFISEYKNLRTPNPCVVCNQKIKFDLLLKKAMQIGCDYLATGHYARIVEDNSGMINNQFPISKPTFAKATEMARKVHDDKILKAESWKLKAGLDPVKDQSYNLYRLNQEQLSNIIFPLGQMTKKEVRELAKKWDLPVKEKAESQEICFFGDSDYRDFLRRYLPKDFFNPGEIVDSAGNIIGRHEGLVNYTIGQRKGVDQKLKNRRTKELKNVNTVIPSDSQVLREVEESLYNKKPLYVIGFDIKKNRLIVGEDEEVYKQEMTVSDLYWISPLCQSERGTSRGIPFDSLSVKIRSQAKKVKCKFSTSHPDPIRQAQGRLRGSGVEGSLNNKEISPPVRSSSQSRNDKIGVEFDQPQRAITPGQSAVFYLGDEVIGGGKIR